MPKGPKKSGWDRIFAPFDPNFAPDVNISALTLNMEYAPDLLDIKSLTHDQIICSKLVVPL